ncbi:MAG: helix-turn-helix transcriptional regulator [Rubrivivax sp.]
MAQPPWQALSASDHNTPSAAQEDVHRARQTTMDRSERFYRIEALIRSRGCVCFADLLKELEVSPATLKRDLQYLRDRMNAPIVWDVYDRGYKLQASTGARMPVQHELPGVWFSEREIHALLTMHQLIGSLDDGGVLARHLQPLLDKLQGMLGANSREAALLMKRVRIVSTGRRPVPSKWFELFGDALLRRRRVHMRYQTRGRRAISEREVSPQRLVHYRGTWYLDAWCHRKEQLLRFALDAVDAAQALDLRARDIAIKTVETELDAGYGIFAGRRAQWAHLRFAPEVTPWVSREEWHPAQQARLLDDGGYDLRLPYTNETELVMDVLRHAGNVTVLGPPSLAGAVRAQLEAGLRNATQVAVGMAPEASDPPRR